MPLFRNHYRCYRCESVWDDVWSATCDDECPSCGARHNSPLYSDDESDELGGANQAQRLMQKMIAFIRTPGDIHS